MTINSEHSAIKYRIPFTTYDLGWVVLCIGMAIGAGIIYMPIQAGVKGIWVFVASIGLRRVRISTLRNENETFSQLNSITYIGVFLRLVTYSHLP